MIKQISVFVDNTPGSLAQFTRMLGEKRIDMISLSIADTANFGILRGLVRNPEQAAMQISAAGYTACVSDVLAVEVPDRPGGLSEVLQKLSENGVGIEYLYSFMRAAGRQALIILRPDDEERARQTLGYAILIAAGVGLVLAIWIQFTAQSIVALFTQDAAVAAAGGDYLRGYIWDSFFAGVQLSFSGYFCACGKSGLSFLHNFLSIVLARVPGAYLACKRFPNTLYPMGLASAAGSLLSIIICVIAYAALMRREKKSLQGG